MSKIYSDAASALEGLLRDGLLIASGGFGLCRLPTEDEIDADLINAGKRTITDLAAFKRDDREAPFYLHGLVLSVSMEQLMAYNTANFRLSKL